MKKKTKTFAQKVRNKQKVILYEFLPPPKTLGTTETKISIKQFATILGSYNVDAINIPEVREETRSGKRSNPVLLKLEPRVVHAHLSKHASCDVIINRPVVYLPWKKQKRWFLETYNTYGIRNFIFVGGESSKIIYPGLTVSQTAKKLKTTHKNDFPDIFLGGITIPTRKNEAKRVFAKASSGIEFFTTQVLYEAEKSKKFLKEYDVLCQKNNTLPKTIILSFAPAVTPKDLDLLSWLGVEISAKTVRLITTGWLGIGFRSLDICQNVFEDILTFTIKNHIKVPLGLNVEHISRHNFEISLLLLQRLSGIYNSYTP